MISCRAISKEIMPYIKDVKVYDGLEFNNLSDFLTRFIEEHYYDITENESLIDGIKCKKINQEEYVDKYTLVFKNKPELMIEMYYINTFYKTENINIQGHDIIFAGIKKPPYFAICQAKEKYIVLKHLKPELIEEFDKGLELIKTSLKDLLIKKGNIAFMEELITKANINKDLAYKLIAKACEHYINTNKLN